MNEQQKKNRKNLQFLNLLQSRLSCLVFERGSLVFTGKEREIVYVTTRVRDWKDFVLIFTLFVFCFLLMQISLQCDLPHKTFYLQKYKRVSFEDKSFVFSEKWNMFYSSLTEFKLYVVYYIFIKLVTFKQK